MLLLGVVSSVLIPLVAAGVIAAVVVPLVDVLEHWHVRRWLGGALTLLVALAIVVAVTVLVLKGIADQSQEIAAQASSTYRQATGAEPAIDSAGQLPPW